MLSSGISVQDRIKKIQYHILQLFKFVPKWALFLLNYITLLLLQDIYSLHSNKKKNTLCSFKIPGILSEVSDDCGKTGNAPHVPHFNNTWNLLAE